MFNDQLMRLVTSKLEALGFRTDNDAVIKVKEIDMVAADSVAGAEVVTDFVFPDKCAVLGTVLDVITAEATGGTKTLIAGNETDANGFLNAVDCSSIALVKGTLASGGQTLGELLYVDESGSGVLVPEQDLTSGGEAFCWTPASNDWAEFVGKAYIYYIDLT